MTRGRQVVGWACGKVILLGEHAVVYGVPALAAGIDRGVTAASTEIEGEHCHLRARGWALEIDERDERDLGRAFFAVVSATRANGARRSARSVELSVDLPPGAGLGCSAAMGVAVARALDPDATIDTILSRTMLWERVFHGNPSGIDAAVAARGGIVAYERGKPIEPLAPHGGLILSVGHSGSPSSTRAMVESVAKLRGRHPSLVDGAFDRIRELVQGARLALEQGDRAALGRLMCANQTELRELHLSTPELDSMCKLALRAGALGAKLTGAGGGGCVVALSARTTIAEAIHDAWQRAGYVSFVTKAACATPHGHEERTWA